MVANREIENHLKAIEEKIYNDQIDLSACRLHWARNVANAKRNEAYAQCG